MDDGTAATKHPESYRGTSPVKANKLGHFAYEVSDLDRSVRFWTEVMGFDDVERNEIGMAFLRHGADHHAIALVPAKGGRLPEAGTALRMNHLAFEVDDADVLFKTRDYLKQNDIPVEFEGRKGPGCNISLHFKDPDGYEFELYYSMDQIDETGRKRPAEQHHRVKSLEEAIASPVSATW